MPRRTHGSAGRTLRAPRDRRDCEDTARSGPNPSGRGRIDRRHGGVRPQRPERVPTGTHREERRIATRRGSATVRCTSRDVRPGSGIHPSGGTCRAHHETTHADGGERGSRWDWYRRVPMVEPGNRNRDVRSRKSGPCSVRSGSHRQSVPTGRSGRVIGSLRGPEELTGANRKATRGLVPFPRVPFPRVPFSRVPVSWVPILRVRLSRGLIPDWFPLRSLFSGLNRP